MPYKSKKNRRNISRSPITSPAGETIVAASSGAAQTIKSSTIAGNVKPPAPNAPLKTYFGYEIKWIALVTAIIVILLIAAYYIFR